MNAKLDSGLVCICMDTGFLGFQGNITLREFKEAIREVNFQRHPSVRRDHESLEGYTVRDWRLNMTSESINIMLLVYSYYFQPLQ